MKFDLLGKIIDFNPQQNTITIKLNFLDLDNQEKVEKNFNLPIKITIESLTLKNNPKTNNQLRYYYAMLKAILLAKDITPSAINLKTLDEDTKRRALPCEYLIIDNKKIIVPPPSKADMTIEQLSTLISWLKDTYSYLGINWESDKWY